jgi:hypothetical protein
MAVGSSKPSPPSLGDRRFVVVNREEEEVKKKMISLWKKKGRKKGRATGRGSILTRRGTVKRLCPHPLLHYCQYVPIDCASGSISGANTCVAFHLCGKEKGRSNDVVTPVFKGKTECIDHVCARIKLHTRLDIMNTKNSAARIKSYYKP